MTSFVNSLKLFGIQRRQHKSANTPNLKFLTLNFHDSSCETQRLSFHTSAITHKKVEERMLVNK